MKVTTKPLPSDHPVVTLTLTLTAREASLLAEIMGSVAGGNARDVCDDILEALQVAGHNYDLDHQMVSGSLKLGDWS